MPNWPPPGRGGFNAAWPGSAVGFIPPVYPMSLRMPDGWDPSSLAFTGQASACQTPVCPANCNPLKITIVIHTGGVTRDGIPPFVRQVVYLGGSELAQGWHTEFVVRDPDAASRTRDPFSGMEYTRKCDGFNGFSTVLLKVVRSSVSSLL